MMTVAELIELLKNMPQNADVYIGTSCHGCFEPVGRARLDGDGVVVIEDDEDETGEQ